MASLQEYWDQLDLHDWFYSYSDDNRVWKRGEAEKSALLAIAKSSPEHQALYDGFHKHHFSGKAWNTEKAEKPARPEA